MSVVHLIDLFFLLVLVGIAVLLVPGTARTLSMYMTIRSRRLEDATAFAPPEPAVVARVAEALAAIGFSRIGVRSTVLPGIGRQFEWDLIDEATTTYVAIALAPRSPTGFLMAAYSAFADGGFVETTFPGGATVRRSNLHAEAAGHSPAEAIRTHHERVAAFSASHGQPLPNRSMADLLTRDSTYRRTHGCATIRRSVYGLTALTILVVVAAALQLLRVFALDR